MNHEAADEQFQDVWADLALSPDSIDLGSDVHIRYYQRDGVRCGFNEFHKTPAGKWCAGGVCFDLPETAGLEGAKWTVNSMEPLDISPSILCRACGHHGFIRQGRWVSC